MTTFATPEPISINLDLGVGDVRIVASDRTDTLVEVRPSDPSKPGDVSAAEQTRVDYASGRLLISSPKSWRQWTPFGGRESVDVEIRVPAGSDLVANLGVGAVHADGRLGEVNYRTGVGDVRLDECSTLRTKTGLGDVSVAVTSRDADIKTGSGRVDLRMVGGRAVIKNSNGDTFIGEVDGDARIQSANGRIAVDRAAASLVAKTALGDIRLADVSHGSVDANTAYGQVEVGVRDGVAAWLDLHTSFGQVQNDLDDAAGPGPGQPTVEVKAHTAMGDIAIHRAPMALSSYGD